MDIIVGVATFPGREASLEVMLNSLERQTLKPSRIHVYDNAIEPDLTDLGKFRYLENYADSDCYYFSVDDDIEYPNTYIADTVALIESRNIIWTYHGRILCGVGLNYYSDHEKFRCMYDVHESRPIDVCGTGVTAFRTSYFCPKDLFRSPDMKMADVIFSLEAARQNKEIYLAKHEAGYFRSLPSDPATSCCGTQGMSCERQGELCDLLYQIKYPEACLEQL